jgi:thiamine biosynthesis lipoprotein
VISAWLGLLLAADPELYEGRAQAMGTELRIDVVLGPKVDRAGAEAAFTAARNEVERLESELSEWRPNSPFGRLNTAPTEGVVLSPEAYGLLERALGWSKASGGAFDPTFASLWGLWRFDAADRARIPTEAEAKARARAIDYRKVVLDPKRQRVRLGPGMKLGLGGIAKGYAVDRVVDLLRSRGLEDFFVKFGGELYLAGRRGARPWIAGIQDPRDGTRHFAVLALENSAFTTSGDYEHALIKDGVRYHHLIDPATGYPARKCRSVTIVAPRNEDADALSTSVFVLGPEAGLALIKARPGVEVVIVTASGEVVVSPGLQGKVKLGQPIPWTGP